MLQGILKSVLIELDGYFKGFSKNFEGCFKEVLKVLQGNFKGVSRDRFKLFREVSQKDVLRKM